MDIDPLSEIAHALDSIAKSLDPGYVPYAVKVARSHATQDDSEEPKETQFDWGE